MAFSKLKSTGRSLIDKSVKPWVPEVKDLREDNEIYTIEIRKQIDENTSISSFSTVDIKEVEKSWTDHFEKQQPIPVDIINKS